MLPKDEMRVCVYAQKASGGCSFVAQYADGVLVVDQVIAEQARTANINAIRRILLMTGKDNQSP